MLARARRLAARVGRDVGQSATIAALIIGCVVSAPASAQSTGAFGLGGHVGAALDRGGFVGGVSVRHAFTPRLAGGFSAEWSPWFDVLSAKFARGTANAYVTVSWKWVGTESVDVRSALHAGGSVLLFEPIGARQGAVGVFGGISLLSLWLRLAPAWSLELSPDVTLAVPSLTGVPLGYRQYRLIITLIHWF